MKTDPVELFIEAWKLMTGRLPSPRFENSDGVASCFCDSPNLFFNLWVQSRPAAEPDAFRALLATGAERADASEHPVGAVIREDWAPANWKALVEARGLEPMVPMIAMEADDLLPPRRPLPDVDIRRVTDDAGASDLAALNAHAYDMPVESFDVIANMRLWRPDSTAFVGYADGKPVASASAFPVLGTVYVALVATAAEARRKGYAKAVMRRAVEEGQKMMCVTRTTLHASMMGHPLYEAMGYASGARLALAGPAHQ